MTEREVLALLILVNRAERRTMTPEDLAATAQAWHPVFRDDNPGVVREAWEQYLASDPGGRPVYFMPANLRPFIRRVVARIERDTPRPAIPARQINFDRALNDAQTAWFIQHPGATVQDYEKAHNT